MIFQNSDIEKYTFIFDVNDGSPFDGSKYLGLTFPEDEWLYELNRQIPIYESRGVPAKFIEMKDWLVQQDILYQAFIAHMRIEGYSPVLAVAIQVSEDMATLFKLFWH